MYLSKPIEFETNNNCFRKYLLNERRNHQEKQIFMIKKWL